MYKYTQYTNCKDIYNNNILHITIVIIYTIYTTPYSSPIPPADIYLSNSRSPSPPPPAAVVYDLSDDDEDDDDAEEGRGMSDCILPEEALVIVVVRVVVVGIFNILWKTSVNVAILLPSIVTENEDDSLLIPDILVALLLVLLSTRAPLLLSC